MYYNLASVLSDQGKYDESEYWMQKGIELDPRYNNDK
ncbi:tetratricopeptide repeat protein [Chondrinema litorale]